MEANEKPKYSDFEKDFIKFKKAKDKFLKKHGKVIGGFRTYITKTENYRVLELETITDDGALNQHYDMTS